MAFLSENLMNEMGIKHGKNVLISTKCSIYSNDIVVGDNVRIDDFCILSGSVHLGNNIHIGAYCALYGKYGIFMEDYTGLSPRCTIFSATDDFGGDFMISPMTPDKYTHVIGAPVYLRKFVQIGSGTVIMQGVELNEGCAIGAMSFVKKSIPAWEIWAGNPLWFIKERRRGMIELEKQYQDELRNT